jgi:hypothetical protein
VSAKNRQRQVECLSLPIPAAQQDLVPRDKARRNGWPTNRHRNANGRSHEATPRFARAAAGRSAANGAATSHGRFLWQRGNWGWLRPNGHDDFPAQLAHRPRRSISMRNREKPSGRAGGSGGAASRQKTRPQLSQLKCACAVCSPAAAAEKRKTRLESVFLCASPASTSQSNTRYSVTRSSVDSPSDDSTSWCVIAPGVACSNWSTRIRAGVARAPQLRICAASAGMSMELERGEEITGSMGNIKTQHSCMCNKVAFEVLPCFNVATESMSYR